MGEGKIIVLLYPFHLFIAFIDKETADSNHPNSASVKPKRLSPLNYIVRGKVERKKSIARIEIYFNCMTLVACDSIPLQECTKFTRI